ncbi:MAG: hypothetical protein WKG32_11970 [Gemmatimonadaceae bacterium]
MSRTRQPLVAASALLLAIAACSNDSTAPSTSDQESADVAAVVGDATAEDVSLLITHEGLFGQVSSDARRTGPWQGNCPYDAASTRFICPTNSREGLTVSRSYQLRDASGQPQSAYSATTTASANFVATLAASVARDNFTATYSRQRNITVSGLAGAETQHIINGSGSTSNSRSRHTDAGAARSYSMSSSMTIVDLVIPVPRAADSWPLSGAITHQVAASRDRAQGDPQSRTRTATVTFNGTQFVPLVVGDRTFTLDLATGKRAAND